MGSMRRYCLLFLSVLTIVTIAAACDTEPDVMVQPTPAATPTNSVVVARLREPTAEPTLHPTTTPTPTLHPTTTPTPTSTPTPTATAMPTQPAIGNDVQGSADPAAIETATAALLALRQRDMSAFAALAHPDGVRFAPYASLGGHDLVFSPAQVATLYDDNQLHTWGIQSGTGDPILLAFPDYFERYVYGVEYVSADIVGLNERVATTNQLPNITNYYDSPTIIEYHFTGFDDAYSGMDWQSLLLVLLETEDGWRIVAVINDEWTI